MSSAARKSGAKRPASSTSSTAKTLHKDAPASKSGAGEDSNPRKSGADATLRSPRTAAGEELRPRKTPAGEASKAGKSSASVAPKQRNDDDEASKPRKATASVEPKSVKAGPGNESRLRRASIDDEPRPRRTSQRNRPVLTRKRSKETNEWITAGAIFLGLIIAVVVGIHVIGGHSTTTPNAGNGFFGNGTGNGFRGFSQRTAIQSAVANALGITTDTLTTDLQSGQTVQQIATAQNVPIATVNTAYLNAVKQQFDQAVTNGSITQAQADQIYSQQQQQVSNGQYSFLQNFLNATPTPAS